MPPVALYTTSMLQSIVHFEFSIVQSVSAHFFLGSLIAINVTTSKLQNNFLSVQSFHDIFIVNYSISQKLREPIFLETDNRKE